MTERYGKMNLRVRSFKMIRPKPAKDVFNFLLNDVGEIFFFCFFLAFILMML